MVKKRRKKEEIRKEKRRKKADMDVSMPAFYVVVRWLKGVS